MTSNDRQLLLDLEAKLEANPSVKSYISKILSLLPACEYELILFMHEKGVWEGPFPQPPEGFKKGDGYIELGLFNHWIHNPTELDLSEFTLKEQMAILALVTLLSYYVSSSKITPANYAFFDHNELIYVDGTVLSTETYANFDQMWFFAFLNLAQSAIHELWYNGGTFPSTAPPPIQLTGADPGSVDIAVLGDWGTGDKAAKGVIDQLKTLDPDYILHVGDVYYAGTPSKTSPNGDKYWIPGEEHDNLMALWPPGFDGKSFTLNSNHEMYSGANGYFYDALQAASTPPGSGSPFSRQAGSSCFALTFGGWTILCLDSAFEASTLDVFMVGSIGSADGTQGKWVQSLDLDHQKTIVMTHHNGFADDCTSVSPLWAEIRAVLGGDPYAWYWGHIHNGIVYDAPISIPATDKSPALETSTYSRCLGHSAVPYGAASSLGGKPIAWQTDSQIPGSRQLYNGFAVLTLTDSGGSVTITEKFYDPSSKKPKWEKQIYPVV